LLQLLAHFFVLHKAPTLGGRQANVDRLDKAGVMFQVMAQQLSSEFVGLKAALAAISANRASFSG
jgi:hypothetical protein